MAAARRNSRSALTSNWLGLGPGSIGDSLLSRSEESTTAKLRSRRKIPAALARDNVYPCRSRCAGQSVSTRQASLGEFARGNHRIHCEPRALIAEPDRTDRPWHAIVDAVAVGPRRRQNCGTLRTTDSGPLHLPAGRVSASQPVATVRRTLVLSVNGTTIGDNKIVPGEPGCVGTRILHRRNPGADAARLTWEWVLLSPIVVPVFS